MKSEPNSDTSRPCVVSFTYKKRNFQFRGRSANDLVLHTMQNKSTFYELDVLESIKRHLEISSVAGIGIDAGAFIGSHSVYFANFCGLSRVYAFEANAETFDYLVQNVAGHHLQDKVTCINQALGAKKGWGESVNRFDDNFGANYVKPVTCATENSVPVLPLDEALKGCGDDPVRLLKIDVEGMELNVLTGARRLIAKHRPILCVEMHSGQHLWQALMLLRNDHYVVLDCLGASPTYLLQSKQLGRIRAWISFLAWFARAVTPIRFNTMRWRLKRIGQAFTSKENQ